MNASQISSTMSDFMVTYSWATKLVCLAAFILLMVMVVALGWKEGDLHVLFLVRRSQQRPRRVRLHRARFEFKKLSRSPGREEKSTLVGFWNPPRHDELLNEVQEIGFPPDAPSLFAEDKTTDGPTHVDQYFGREIQETKTVAVSSKTLATIGAEHSKFLMREFGKLRSIPRDKNGVRHLEGKSAYQQFPNFSEDGHYFVEMKFAIDPWFVLTEHPDGQVKTTAWLTVLTSLFAMFMQLIYNGFG